jgi:hypothetical protein
MLTSDVVHAAIVHHTTVLSTNIYRISFVNFAVSAVVHRIFNEKKFKFSGKIRSNEDRVRQERGT